MMASLRVSVVIATHNRAGYIGQAIHSALEQTAPPFEVIVVDDGSTDATPRVLAEFASDIRIVNQPHKGRSAARNAGANHVRGDIIAFLDSDDLWLPHKLAKQLELLESRPTIGVVHAFSDVVDENGVRLKRPTSYRQKLYRRALKRGYTYEGMSRECTLFLSTVAVRCECWKRVGPMDTDIPAFEDWDWYLRASRETEIATIAETLVHYRHHSGNTASGEFFEGQLKTCRKHLALLDQWPQSSLRERARCNFYLQLASAYYVHGSSSQAGKFMRNAVRIDPSILLHPSHWRYSLAMSLPTSLFNRMRRFVRHFSRETTN